MNLDDFLRKQATAPGTDPDRLVEWLLDGMRLAATVFHVGQYAGRWRASTAGRALGSFHLILHGGCWLHCDCRDPVELAPGDAVFMLRDLPHVLGPHLLGPDVAAPGGHLSTRMQPLGAPAPGTTGLACGFFHFDDALSSLVVDSFPDCLVLRAGDAPAPALRVLFDLILAEAARPPDAPSPLIARLAELIFFYAVRHVARRADLASGLLAVACRPEFAGLLAGVIDAPGRAWSTVEMARTAHMSRSSFYTRFSEASGLAPAQFLLLLRMKIAARRLQDGESVERTAGQVGYASYAAFARAFKKTIGIQPGAFRRRGRDEPDAHALDDRAQNPDAAHRTSAGAGLRTGLQ